VRGTVAAASRIVDSADVAKAAERSDEELLTTARAGNRDALETLLLRYQPKVYGFGMKMCRDPEDAKDVLLAGSMIAVSLLLGYTLSPAWHLLAAFVALNLMQSAFTGFCPAEKILRRLGTI